MTNSLGGEIKRMSDFKNSGFGYLKGLADSPKIKCHELECLLMFEISDVLGLEHSIKTLVLL